MQSREHQSKINAEDQLDQHLLRLWDFEQLLAELRRNPVLRGDDRKTPIIAKEYFARA